MFKRVCLLLNSVRKASNSSCLILLSNSFWTSLLISIEIVVSERLILLDVKVAYNCLLPVLLFSSANCLTASCALSSVKGMSSVDIAETCSSVTVACMAMTWPCCGLFCNKNWDFIFKSLKLTTGFALVWTIGVSENLTKGVGVAKVFCSPSIWKLAPNSSFFFPHLLIRHLNN